MNSFKVALIARSDSSIPLWVHARLQEAGVTLVDRACQDAQEIVDLASDAHVVWTMGSNMIYGADGWREVIREALGALSTCGAILRSGSGTDNIPIDEATKRRILVVNTPEATAEPVAEFAVALMLSVGRQIVKNAISVRAGSWEVPSRPTQLALTGKTVGLVGFGRIAHLVARNLHGFNVKLLACDPCVDKATMARHDVTKVDLDALLAAADFVSIHCPLIDATRGMIGESQLARMKASAILINTARGAVVDEPALIDALRHNRIAGAGLDVLEKEPLPAHSPLRAMDNVVLTPHVAAFSEQIFDELWRLSVEAVIDLAQGRWPRSVANSVVPKWALRPRDRHSASDGDSNGSLQMPFTRS